MIFQKRQVAHLTEVVMALSCLKEQVFYSWKSMNTQENEERQF